MSYCVNCGVELAPAEKKCPLCNTPVINPALLKKDNDSNDSSVLVTSFPPYQYMPIQKVSKKSILELVTLVFFIPMSLSVFCDLTITDSFSWSGYVVFSLALLYLICVIPFIPKKANAIISLALDGLGTSAFLYYINYMTNGKWFLHFALPITVVLTSLLVLQVSLSLYTHIEPLTLTAIGCFLVGLLCLFIEFMINLSFGLRNYLIWSVYPFVLLSILGVILFSIDRNRPLKEKLKKRFFI